MLDNQIQLEVLVLQNQVVVVLCDILYQLYLPSYKLLCKYLVLDNNLLITHPEKVFEYLFYDIADVCPKTQCYTAEY